jgi:hypothetical protein
MVLLDSGNYEKSRKEDLSWRLHRFYTAMKRTPHDLALSFDKLNPDGGVERIIKEVVRTSRRDGGYTGAPLIPILHLPRCRNDDYKTELAPELALGVAEELRPVMLAIPERELGVGLFQRARNLAAIRIKLGELHRYQPIHILGTGNPISIALLTAAGADSFDGLEWCRFVANAEDATLHHFQHYDLYEYQAKLARSAVTSSAAANPAVHYVAKAAYQTVHQTWIGPLRGPTGSSLKGRWAGLPSELRN